MAVVILVTLIFTSFISTSVTARPGPLYRIFCNNVAESSEDYYNDYSELSRESSALISVIANKYPTAWDRSRIIRKSNHPFRHPFIKTLERVRKENPLPEIPIEKRGNFFVFDVFDYISKNKDKDEIRSPQTVSFSRHGAGADNGNMLRFSGK